MDLRKVILLILIGIFTYSVEAQTRLYQIEPAEQSNTGDTRSSYENYLVITKLDTFGIDDYRLYYEDTMFLVQYGADSAKWVRIGDTVWIDYQSGADMYSWFADTDAEVALEILDGNTLVFSDGANMSVTRSGNVITFAATDMTDHDWYELPGSAPDNINDTIYTFGWAGIGLDTVRRPLDVEGRDSNNIVARFRNNDIQSAWIQIQTDSFGWQLGSHASDFFMVFPDSSGRQVFSIHPGAAFAAVEINDSTLGVNFNEYGLGNHLGPFTYLGGWNGSGRFREITIDQLGDSLVADTNILDHDWYLIEQVGMPDAYVDLITRVIYTKENVVLNRDSLFTGGVELEIHPRESEEGSGDANEISTIKMYGAHDSTFVQIDAVKFGAEAQMEIITQSGFQVREYGGTGQFVINNDAPAGSIIVYPTTGELQNEPYGEGNFLNNDAVYMAAWDAAGNVLEVSIDALGDSIALSTDHDWYEIGTTDSPNNIADSMYNLSNRLRIGQDSLPDDNGSSSANVLIRGGSLPFETVSTIPSTWRNMSESGAVTKWFDFVNQGGDGYLRGQGGGLGFSMDLDYSGGSPAVSVEQGGDLGFGLYANTRNDAGNPVNILSTGTLGELESHSPADLAATGAFDDADWFVYPALTDPATSMTDNIGTMGDVTVIDTNVNGIVRFRLENDAQRFQFNVQGTSGDVFSFFDETNNTRPFKIYPNQPTDLLVLRNNKIGINNVNPAVDFDVTGNVRHADYGGGLITGTLEYLAGYDVDGDIIEVDPAASQLYNLEADRFVFTDGNGDFTTSATWADSIVFMNSTNRYGLLDDDGNVFWGLDAGQDNAGVNNVFIGIDAGDENTSGGHNIAIGFAPMSVGVTTGSFNTTLGYWAGQDLTSGQRNFYAGVAAGLESQGASYNIAIGDNAGRENVSGNTNVYLGRNAGYYMLNDYNIGIGYLALEGETGGVSTGDNNVGIGRFAGRGITSGLSNFFMGYQAGNAVSTGSWNILFGQSAALALQTGSDNIAFGRDVMFSAGAAVSDNIVFGAQAGQNLTGDNNIIFGNQTAQNATSISDELWINNSNEATPTIWANMATDSVRLNATLNIRDIPQGSATDSLLVFDANHEIRKYGMADVGSSDADWFVYPAMTAAPTLITEDIGSQGEIHAIDHWFSGVLAQDSLTSSRIQFPRGGSQTVNGAGAIRIDMPSAAGWDACEVVINLQIREDLDDTEYDITLAGSLAPSTWSEVSATVVGTDARQIDSISFGSRQTDVLPSIWLEDTSGSWTNANVTILDVIVYGTNRTVQNWRNGWNIVLDNVTTGDVYQENRNITQILPEAKTDSFAVSNDTLFVGEDGDFVVLPSTTFTGTANKVVYTDAAGALAVEATDNFAYNETTNQFTTPGKSIFANDISTGTAIVEIGEARTGVGDATLDFHTQVGNDWDARLYALSGGNFDINNNSVSGSTRFYLNGAYRAQINPTGQIRFWDYTTGTSFNGTDVGMLSFSNTGLIQTMSFQEVADSVTGRLGETYDLNVNTESGSGTIADGETLNVLGFGAVNTSYNDGSKNLEITYNDPDASATNELQDFTNSSTATTHRLTLAASGGDYIEFIEGSNITLTTGGTAARGTVTIASTGGGDPDQDFSNSSTATTHRLTLTSSGGDYIEFIEGTNITFTSGGTAAQGTVTINSSGAADGDGIYDGSGTIPTGTIATVAASGTFQIEGSNSQTILFQSGATGELQIDSGNDDLRLTAPGGSAYLISNNNHVFIDAGNGSGDQVVIDGVGNTLIRTTTEIGGAVNDQLVIASTSGNYVRMYHDDNPNTAYLEFQDGGPIVISNSGATTGSDISIAANDVLLLNGGASGYVSTSASDLGVRRIPTTNDLEVAGAASKAAAGDWLANSDMRLKKNIVQLDGSEMLARLLKLRGVAFEWNEINVQLNYERPAGVQYGLIAQDIIKGFDQEQYVFLDNDGYYQAAYSTYDPVYIEALRYMNDRTEQLIKDKRDMEARIDYLEQQIQSLIKNNKK